MYQPKKEKEAKFAFELEKQIAAKPTHAKEILDQVEKRILGIKNNLREGVKGEEFDQLGILLHGYSAMQKVIKKIAK